MILFFIEHSSFGFLRFSPDVEGRSEDKNKSTVRIYRLFYKVYSQRFVNEDQKKNRQPHSVTPPFSRHEP